MIMLINITKFSLLGSAGDFNEIAAAGGYFCVFEGAVLIIRYDILRLWASSFDLWGTQMTLMRLMPLIPADLICENLMPLAQ